MVCLDGFSGSGVVSRLLKYHSKYLVSNDLEDYAWIINKCYLANKSEVDLPKISATIKRLNEEADANPKGGFIYENYAPKDDNAIQAGERVFYTGVNAKKIDTLKELIYSNIAECERHFYLAPLIVASSIHTNTSGVFKGFHKKNGIGHFGGAGENALVRIKKEIKLQPPIFSDCECKVEVTKQDINELVKNNKAFDLAYFDPPYNQHPYGSNYFMLNILATAEKQIPIQCGVSGIAEKWNRSEYNKRQRAINAMDDLIRNTNAKYFLISYNNEGIIPAPDFKKILSRYGTYELFEQDYYTYRGSRNLKARNKIVTELLWILKKEVKNV